MSVAAVPTLTRRERERERERWTGRRAGDLSGEQLAQAMAAGYEPDDGYLIGRDPRTMTTAELGAIGHERLSPMDAIRAKCLDCAGSAHEVRLCGAVTCPSWPFRTGKNPWRAPPSEVQREASRRNAARMHAGASAAMSFTGLNEGTGDPAPGAAAAGPVTEHGGEA